MKSLLAAILVFEAVVVALAIPVAVLADDRGTPAAVALAVLAVLLVAGAGLVRRPYGVGIGWALQALVCLSGLLVPATAVLGLVFLGVWVVAIIYGAKGDRLAAERAAQARGDRPGVGSVTPGPPADASGPPPADG